MSKTVAVLSAMARPLIEPRLPDWVDARFFATTEELFALAPEAEIGWFDLYKKDDMAKAMRRAVKLKWLNTIYAGVDEMPLDILAERGVTYTYGAGINAVTIAEYIVMAMLNVAKDFRAVLRAAEQQNWLPTSPGKVELAGSKALIIGYGAIGKLLEARLRGFEVEVTAVRRSSGAGTIGPDEWRERLGNFDWVILVVPATPETQHMIGARELAAMKPSATLLNFARGSVVDQDALLAALSAKQIGHAFLDVTTPEPLPADHPLWLHENATISMHLSGQAQDKMFARGVERFFDNLDRYRRGERMEPQVNLALGY
jgi:phosphoglycerate dehydrogenase-like enzyme